jgi:hypothetical protein
MCYLGNQTCSECFESRIFQQEIAFTWDLLCRDVLATSIQTPTEYKTDSTSRTGYSKSSHERIILRPLLMVQKFCAVYGEQLSNSFNGHARVFQRE